jgi:hypothetical protein
MPAHQDGRGRHWGRRRKASREEPATIEADKHFPNLGSTIAACADAFGWHEICSPYACDQPFQCPAARLVALALLPISGV